MSKVNPASVHTFNDGDVVTAGNFNPMFSAMIAAINDNSDRIDTLIAGGGGGGGGGGGSTTPTGVVSVKAFGAVGNGIVDDTNAIQNALVYAQPLGYAIYFPAGTYVVSNTIVLSSTDSAYLYTEENATIAMTNRSVNLFTLSAIATIGMVFVKNLKVLHIPPATGTGSSCTLFRLSFLSSTTTVIFDNCKFEWQTSAPYACIETLYADRVHIRECIFYETLAYAVRLRTPQKAYITNNFFSDGFGAACIILDTPNRTSTGTGQWQDTTTYSTNHGLIHGNVFNMQLIQNVILLYRANNVTISDNLFNVGSPSSVAGLSVDAVIKGFGVIETSTSTMYNGQNLAIAGNNFSAYAAPVATSIFHRDAISLSNYNNVSITGNNFEAMGAYFTSNTGVVSLSSVNYTSITGNTFLKTQSRAAIYLYIALGTVISSNTFYETNSGTTNYISAIYELEDGNLRKSYGTFVGNDFNYTTAADKYWQLYISNSGYTWTPNIMFNANSVDGIFIPQTAHDATTDALILNWMGAI